MQDPVREKLITDHLPLVRRVSERLHASWRERGLELSELVACGALGLVQAADRFDPTRGIRFKTFAEIVIEGAIRDGVGRGRNWFGRRAVGTVVVVHLNDVAPEGWEEWLGQPDENGLPLPALWNGCPLFQPPRDSDLDLRSLLADEIQLLPERERRVIRLCFYEDKKLTDAAKELCVQPPRASRLRKQALRRLRHAIDGRRNRLPEAASRQGSVPTDKQEPLGVVD
ncbi:MAG TPA: sigma-70 family RNA polymerase sigma factor [Polyangia bacterium]|nr:sigma-70 family RNA polymerase sigma factor [Polyangia bacterium]